MTASFVDLCHHSWAIPVLAVLADSGGAKVITVARRLQVAPETARRTIRALVGLDLAMANPGYGHPMRPEFLLSPDGEAIGRPTIALWISLEGASDAARGACRRKWSLPALVALDRAADRFSEIQGGLPGVTPRALAQTLDALMEAGLVERDVEEGPPVRTRYALTVTSEPIARAARAMERRMTQFGPGEV